jgi:hypothetical protein
MLGDKKDVTLLGTATDAPNGKVESPKFTLSIVTAQGFDLTVSSPVLVRQGGTVKVQVTAVRRGYDGPITVELRGLPKLVMAPTGTIPHGQTTVSIDLTADGQAKRGDTSNVLAVGTTTALGSKEFPSPQFTVTVQGPPSFVLKVDPGKVVILPGAIGSVRVTATRIDYDGPIDVMLMGLPPQVTAPAKVTIPQGQPFIDVPLTVQGGAPTGDKNNVVAQGSAASVNITNVLSANFTVSVAGKPTTTGTFTLKADHVKVKHNMTATLTVHVTRMGGFNGAINIVVKNLPPGVSAAPFVIPAGQNKGTTTVAATATAQVVVTKGVTVHGTTDTLQIDSPPFELDVLKK